MTPKQARFIAEYTKDCNGTQAAIRAGYSARVANRQASRLLSNADIRAEIARNQSEIIQETRIDAQKVLQELARLALVDARAFYDEAGDPKPMSEWTPEMGAAVAGMETIIKNAKAGDGITDKVLKLRFWDKNRALDTLAKHFGLLVDVNINVNASIEQVAGVLEAARRRLAEVRG